MPLTPQQRTEKLLKYNLDPTKYELGDDGVTVYERDEAPVVQDAPVSVAPAPRPREMTTGQVAQTVLPRAIAPTLGGFAGGALGGAAVSGPLAPLGAIVGGLVGGFGTGYLQEKINPMTPDEARMMQRARTERPLTSLAMETAPALIAMKPSINTLKNAGTGLRELTTKGLGSVARPTLQPVQQAALANVGIGAALGAGTEAAAQLVGGEDLNLTRIAGATLANALITDPNKLGQRLFRFAPSGTLAEPPVSIENSQNVDLRKNWVPAPPKPPAPIPERQQVYKDMADLDTIYEQNMANVAKQTAIAKNVEAKKMREYVAAQTELATAQRDAEIADIKAQAEMIKNMSKPFVGSDVVLTETGETVSKPLQFTRPSEQVAKAKPFVGELVEPVRGLAAKAATAPVEVVDIARPVGLGSEVVIEQPATVLRTPRGGELPAGAGTQKLKTAAEMTAKKGKALYAEEGSLEATQELLAKQGVELNPLLNKDTRKVAARLAERLGYKYNETNAKIINPKTGDEVPGRALVEQAVAEFNPTVSRGPKSKPAGLDIPQHEIFHLFLEELRTNGTKFEKDLVARGEQLFGGNEPLVRDGGVRAVYSLYDKSHPISKYLRQLWSHMKLRFGKGGSEDAKNWLVARMMDAPPRTGVDTTAPLYTKTVKGQTGTTTIESSTPLNAEEGSTVTPKATYLGEQSRPDGTSFSLYNTPDGSTVTAETLQKLGFEVPPKPETKMAESGSDIAPQQRNVDLSSEEGRKRMAEMKKRVHENSVIDSLAEALEKQGVIEGWKGAASEDFSQGNGQTVSMYYGQLNRLNNGIDDRQLRLLSRVSEADLAQEQLAEKLGMAASESDYRIWSPEDNLQVYKDLVEATDKKTVDSILAGMRQVDKPTSAQDKKALATLPQQKLAEEGSPIQPKTQDELNKERHAVASVLTSQIDKVRQEGPSGNYAADKATANEALRSQYEGQYAEDIKRVIQDAQLTKAEDTMLQSYMHDMRHQGESDIQLPTNLQELEAQIRSHLVKIADDSAAKNIKIYNEQGDGRFINKDPNYVPDMLDPLVADEWSTNPASAKSEDYLERYARWAMSKDEDLLKIEDLTERYNAAYTLAEQYAAAVRKAEGHNSVDFAALRRAQGIGLPKELAEKSIERLMYRYGKRVARDFAFWETIQSDKVARKIFGFNDEFGKKVASDEVVTLPDGTEAKPLVGGKDIEALKRSIMGKQVHDMKRIRTAARVVGSMIMQIPTGLRDLASIPLNSLPYMGMGEGMRYGLKAFNNVASDFKGAVNRARRMGAVKQQFSDMLLGDPDPVADKMNKLTEMFSKYGGRELLERTSRTMTYAIGEEFAKGKLLAAQSGNKEAQRLLKRMSASVLEGVEKYFTPGTQVPDEVVAKIAKEFTDAVQGSYSEAGLPTWAIEGSVAPFVSLQRWSIEKSNTIYKDVIKPMYSGNYGPFLRYSLGAMMTGVAIEQLNELLNNSRGYEATTKEVLTASEADKADMAKKFVSLMQMAGYGGIVSDVAKFGLAAGGGNYTKYNSPLSYPLYSYVTDTLAGNISDYVEAINLGEDPFWTTARFVDAVTSQSLQNYRVLRNYANATETERKEMNRDYRVWQELSGDAGAKMTPDYNRFVGVEERKFKTTTSPDEAIEVGEKLMNRYLDEEDPRKTAEKLSALRRMPITWSPSMESNPQEFLQYVDYVRDTQGPSASDNILQKYVEQTIANAAKKTLVPALKF